MKDKNRMGEDTQREIYTEGEEESEKMDERDGEKDTSRARKMKRTV